MAIEKYEDLNSVQLDVLKEIGNIVYVTGNRTLFEVADFSSFLKL